MSNFVITNELLGKIGKLRPSIRKKALQLIGEQEWKRCAEDIFYWLDPKQHPILGPYVYTKDPHPMYVCQLCKGSTLAYRTSDRDKHLTVAHGIESKTDGETRGYFIELDACRPFPYTLPYVKPVIYWWLREPIMILEKSRDMTATWLTVAMYTWDTIFHRGRENIFQSEDATKTLDLVERANFIYRNQPKFLRDVAKADFSIGAGKSGRLSVPKLESVLLGFPQGPDQIRQYHPSGVFQDEAAFQVSAGDAFAAIKPAIQNGGRFTAVSSAYPSWFMHAARDTLDSLAG
jgi:hypothetical protein